LPLILPLRLSIRAQAPRPAQIAVSGTRTFVASAVNRRGMIFEREEYLGRNIRVSVAVPAASNGVTRETQVGRGRAESSTTGETGLPRARQGFPGSLAPTHCLIDSQRPLRRCGRGGGSTRCAAGEGPLLLRRPRLISPGRAVFSARPGGACQQQECRKMRVGAPLLPLRLPLTIPCTRAARNAKHRCMCGRRGAVASKAAIRP
jgi:hypothetical protein